MNTKKQKLIDPLDAKQKQLMLVKFKALRLASKSFPHHGRVLSNCQAKSVQNAVKREIERLKNYAEQLKEEC